MPMRFDFRLEVIGPAHERQKLENALRSLPTTDHVADVSTFLGVRETAHMRIYEYGMHDNICLLAAAATRSVPLYLVETLARMFPSLKVECYIISDYEWNQQWTKFTWEERWRAKDGQHVELIEEAITMPYWPEHVWHEYVKDGEQSVFFDTAKFAEMEAAVNRIISTKEEV